MKKTVNTFFVYVEIYLHFLWSESDSHSYLLETSDLQQHSDLSTVCSAPCYTVIPHISQQMALTSNRLLYYSSLAKDQLWWDIRHHFRKYSGMAVVLLICCDCYLCFYNFIFQNQYLNIYSMAVKKILWSHFPHPVSVCNFYSGNINYWYNMVHYVYIAVYIIPTTTGHFWHQKM